jgi:hypothetical protein
MELANRENRAQQECGEGEVEGEGGDEDEEEEEEGKGHKGKAASRGGCGLPVKKKSVKHFNILRIHHNILTKKKQKL